ncbi:MAG: NADH:ubiquinone oxidoreductase [Pseudomonadota bacterium]
MSNQTQGSLLLVAAISGGIGFVAFLLLIVLGEYAFSPAVFMAAALAVVVALFLLIAFHGKSEPMAASKPAVATPPKAQDAPEPVPAPEPVADPEPAPAPTPAPQPVAETASEGTRPEALDGPRGGKADDLKRIKGVGPKMEKLCNSLGFYHFDQIASWNAEEVAWVDANLEGFKGRVTRDTWVDQAKLLASGGETEFSKKVDDGDVY